MICDQVKNHKFQPEHSNVITKFRYVSSLFPDMKAAQIGG